MIIQFPTFDVADLITTGASSFMFADVTSRHFLAHFREEFPILFENHTFAREESVVRIAAIKLSCTD